MHGTMNIKLFLRVQLIRVMLKNTFSGNSDNVRIVQEKKMSQLSKLSLRCVGLNSTVIANMNLYLTVFEAETK